MITRSQPPRPLRQRAVETAGECVRELGIAEVIRQDVTIQDGKVSEFRVPDQGGSTPPAA